MKLIVWYILLVALFSLSVILTLRASREVEAPGKVLRFLGIAVSTIPIIGFIQAAIFARMKHKLYSEGCAVQAVAGILYYLTVTKLLPLLG